MEAFLFQCFLQVNAFVKRDAPKEGEKDLGEQIKDWATKTFDPENLKNNFNKAIDDVSKAVSICFDISFVN